MAKFFVEIEDVDFEEIKNDIVTGWAPNWTAVLTALEDKGFNSARVTPMDAFTMGFLIAGIVKRKATADTFTNAHKALEELHKRIKMPPNSEQD